MGFSGPMLPRPRLRRSYIAGSRAAHVLVLAAQPARHEHVLSIQVCGQDRFTLRQVSEQIEIAPAHGASTGASAICPARGRASPTHERRGAHSDLLPQ